MLQRGGEGGGEGGGRGGGGGGEDNSKITSLFSQQKHDTGSAITMPTNIPRQQCILDQTAWSGSTKLVQGFKITLI